MPAVLDATCPRCGVHGRLLPILFGLPTYEAFQRSQRGEFVLGGCVVGRVNPTHRCSACGRDVRMPRPIAPNATPGSGATASDDAT